MLEEESGVARAHREQGRRRRRTLLAVQIGVVVLAVAGYVLHRLDLAHDRRFLSEAAARLEAGDHAGAIDALTRHIDAYPDDGDAQVRLAELFDEVGDPVAARRVLNGLLDSGLVRRHRVLYALTDLEFRERFDRAQRLDEAGTRGAAAAAYEEAADYLMSQGSVDDDPRVVTARGKAGPLGERPEGDP